MSRDRIDQRRQRKLLHEVERCRRPDGRFKLGYRSAAKARQAIVEHKHRTARLFVYECPRCGLWHITSRPQ